MSQEITKPVSLKELARLLKQLEDLLISCMRCGFCQQVCPVYGETFREADVTRGKIALLEDLANELTADADNVNDRLNRCLLCGSCETNCPSGVNIMDIFIRARAIVTSYKGLGTVKKLIFRTVLPRPRLFNLFIGISSVFQWPFLRKAGDEKVGAYRAPILNPLLGKRHIPSLPSQTFSSKHGAIDEPGLRGSVALFPGCVPDKVLTSMTEASLKILKKNQVGVFMPGNLVCCGIPALASGDLEGFLVLTSKNLAALGVKKFDYLVTPCATCASNIKENWFRFKDRLPADYHPLVEELHAKTMDITSYLVKVLKVDFKPAEGGVKTVTYHDPCHLKKGLGVGAEPRTILKSIPGVAYKEMPEADRCCGNGGSFNLFHYDLSKSIGQLKRDNIMSVKPEVVATSCPACMLQIMDLLSQNGDQVEVKHVVELYADSL